MLNYRIYSRISREILDKFRPIFFQFDLYTGHKTSPSKPHFIDFMSNSDQCKLGLASKIICNFGQFLAWKSCIRLIRGSTYTRVYTVGWSNVFSNSLFVNRCSSAISLFASVGCDCVVITLVDTNRCKYYENVKLKNR